YRHMVFAGHVDPHRYWCPGRPAAAALVRSILNPFADFELFGTIIDSGVAEQGYVPSGRFRAGDNNPRVGAQQVGAEQPDSQLMMADERGLSRLDARRSEH